MEETADTELVSRYLHGDRQALDVIIQRYFRQVFLFAKTYVKDDRQAEDVSQEVFVKVWKNLDKFDPEKKFKTWLLQITKNTCIDLLRKQKNLLSAGQLDEEVMNESLDRLVDPAPLPQEVFDAAGFAERLEDVIATLQPLYGQVVRMHLQHDLTFQEIAEVLSQPINTIKSRYRRALISIREDLTKSRI